MSLYLTAPFQPKPTLFEGGGPYLLTTQKWIDWFVYMQDDDVGTVRGWKGPPGNQGNLMFKPILNSKYFLISTGHWPDRYFCLKDINTANVVGTHGDPGSRGHWCITTRGDGSFTLSTEQWPTWHIYMQDNPDGSVVGQDGDPGEQGYFKLSCNLNVLTTE